MEPDDDQMWVPLTKAHPDAPGQYGVAVPAGFVVKDVVAAGFVVKDNGQREQLGGGMVRSPATDKTNFALATDGPMFDRYAAHMTKGAKIYGVRNWLKITKATKDEQKAALDRALESAFRHFRQWHRGDVDEDHASAVIFNLNMAELCKELLK
jgi:hypothetical protein